MRVLKENLNSRVMSFVYNTHWWLIVGLWQFSLRTGEQMEMMLVQKGYYGRSLLAVAALTGDKDTFEAVLTTIGTRLDTQKVQRRCLVCGTAHFQLNILH